VEGLPALLEGTKQTLRIRVITDGSDRPVPGAEVVVKLLTTADKPKELFRGVTEGDGTISAEIEIPETPNANAAILCQAKKESRNAEVKQLVLKASSTRG
jgi:hypothetical protein